MLPAVVLLGVPWNPGELVTAGQDARELGARLLVADAPAALARIPDGAGCEAVPLADRRPEAVAEVLSRLPGVSVEAVASLSEQSMELAAAVRTRLGRPGATAGTERAMVDKARCREILAAAGLTLVSHETTTLAGLPEVLNRRRLPVVVKPRALAGSNGVRLVTGPADVADVLAEFDPVVAGRFGRDQLLVEDYVPGPEISVEGVVEDGRLRVFTLTDKVNTGPPYFQECGHIVPSRYAGLLGPVTGYLQDVVTALGMTTSPVHAELKLEPRLDLVEMNARFGGGGIVELVAESRGVRPYAEFLAALLGRPAAPSKPAPPSDGYWGVGFYTARVGRPPAWTSFELPHPSSVVRIDLDLRRQPKLASFEGIRIRFWRPGQALFASPIYAEVHDNIERLAALTDPITQPQEAL